MKYPLILFVCGYKTDSLLLAPQTPGESLEREREREMERERGKKYVNHLPPSVFFFFFLRDDRYFLSSLPGGVNCTLKSYFSSDLNVTRKVCGGVPNYSFEINKQLHSCQASFYCSIRKHLLSLGFLLILSSNLAKIYQCGFYGYRIQDELANL